MTYDSTPTPADVRAATQRWMDSYGITIPGWINTDTRTCALVWGDGWGDHTCARVEGHEGDHRCTCDQTRHPSAETWEDQAAADYDRHRAEERDA